MSEAEDICLLGRLSGTKIGGQYFRRMATAEKTPGLCVVVEPELEVWIELLPTPAERQQVLGRITVVPILRYDSWDGRRLGLSYCASRDLLPGACLPEGNQQRDRRRRIVR